MDWSLKAFSPFKALHFIATVMLFAFITACGSGGFDDDTTTDTTDDDTTTTTTTVSLSISDTNVTAVNPATITASVIDSSGSAVSGVVVTFTLSGAEGVLDPDSGTALTDSSGDATILLTAGSVEGAGEVTGTLSSGETSSVLGFTTAGDGTSTFISFDLALKDPSGADTLNVSGSSPGTLEATLLNGGVGSEGVRVNFSLNGDVGVLSSESALTDSDGIARVVLTPSDVCCAGTVTASVDGGISASKDFEVSISATDVAMSEPTITPASIGANGTSLIEVTITETTNGVTSLLNETAIVQFSSECSQSNTATLDTNVESSNGVFSSTYKDQGCGITDTITISANIGQQLLSVSGTIDVQPASAGSIQFISASPTTIALKGTGGSGRSETSTVTFRVVDSIDKPVQNTGVNFELVTNVGGVDISPDTNIEGAAQTDANGLVDVIVQAGTIPGPVRVRAILESDSDIATLSDELVISTGVADFNSLSLSASDLNPEAWALDGITSTITARASDHFNNPVADGTAITFVTEFGSIDSSCNTVDGLCSVLWTSGAPRVPLPALRDPNAITRQVGDVSVGECLLADGTATNLNAAGYPCFYSNATAATTSEAAFFGGLGQVYGNRVTIRAIVQGEESFTDSNANGVFDDGEAFTDLSEAFTDDNEDGIFNGKLQDGSTAAGASDVDAKCYGTGVTLECYQVGGDNEEFLDFNDNKVFDQANGKYNGLLCPVASEDADICTRDLITIWKNITILQAGSSANISMIESGLDATDSANYFLTTALPASVIAYVADLHNGIMPSGTVISFETGNGEIVGPNACTVGSSSGFAINGCGVFLKADDTSDSGPLVVSVTTPNGAVTTSSITVTD